MDSVQEPGVTDLSQDNVDVSSISDTDSVKCSADSGHAEVNEQSGPPKSDDASIDKTSGGHASTNGNGPEEPPVVEKNISSGPHVTSASDEEVEECEADSDNEPLSYELEQGYRILRELMSDANKSLNWPFMDPVDAESLGLYDYYERIKRPMWLKKMKQKFHARDYTTVTEYVSDMRLMFENCYRYNGPDHYISKRGQKLEIVMEQKLALLSRDLREKTSTAATSGVPVEEKPITGTRRKKVVVARDSSALLSQLRHEAQEREKEARRQLIQDRKNAQEQYLQELNDWVDERLEGKKEEMKSMWEIPQIGHFLFLAGEPLNLGEVVHFELEHGFAMPRESSTIQNIMTSLLSTPYQRTRLDKKPLMPYKVWEEKLRIRLKHWYKVYNDSGRDVQKVASKLGLDPFLFQVLGVKNPMEKRKFHELTFYQRVWIVKSLCDWCLETQESIRNAIESQPQPEQHEYVLGMDAEGNQYLHFPQFCGADLRIYKQQPLPVPKIEKPKRDDTLLQLYDVLVKKTDSSSTKKKKKKRKKMPKVTETTVASVGASRPSRLRQNPKQIAKRPNIDLSDLTSSSSDSESESTQRKPQRKPLWWGTLEFSDTSRESTPLRTIKSRLSGVKNINGDNSGSSRESTPVGTPRRGACATPSKLLMDGTESRESTPVGYTPAAKKGRYVTEKLGSDSRSSTPTYTRRRRKGQRSRRSRRKNNKVAYLQDEDDVDSVEHSNDGFVQDVNSDADIAAGHEGNTGVVQQDSGQGDGVGLVNQCMDRSDIALTGSGDSVQAVEGAKVEMPGGVSGKQAGERVAQHAGNCDKNGATGSEQPANEPVVQNGFAETDDAGYESDQKGKSVPMPEDQDSHQHDIGQEEACESKSGSSNLAPVGHGISDILKTNIAKCIKKEDSGELAESDNSLEMPVSHSLWNTPFTLLDDVKSEPASDSEVVNLSGKKTEKGGQSAVLSVKRSCDSEGTFSKLCKDSETTKPHGIRDSVSGAGDTPARTAKAAPSGGSDHVQMGKETVKLEGGDGDGDEEMDGGEAARVKEEEPKVMAEGENLKTDQQSEESSEEEVPVLAPEVGAFYLVVDSVECLRKLAEQFAEQEPIVVGKGKKQKTIPPPPRKRCVKELYERLMYLLKELEPWEQKLVSANKKAKIKLRKEYEDYKPEPEPKEDVWESEESVSESEDSSDESDSDEDTSPDDSQAEADSVASGKAKQKAVKKKVAEESENGDAKVEDNDDLSPDVSSRGRIRKRRIIPNNIEDQGLPKKKKIEADAPKSAPSTLPNILSNNRNKGNSTTTLSAGTAQAILNQLRLQQNLKGGTVGVSLLNNQTLLLSTPQRTGASTSGGSRPPQTITSLGLSNINLLAQLTKTNPASVSVTTTSGTQSQTQSNTQQVIRALLASGRPVAMSTSNQGVKFPPFQFVRAGINPKVMQNIQQVIVTRTVTATTTSPTNTSQSSSAGNRVMPAAKLTSTANIVKKAVLPHSQPASSASALLKQATSTMASAIPSSAFSVTTTSSGGVPCYNYNSVCSLPPAVIQNLVRQQGSRIKVAVTKAGPEKQSNSATPTGVVMSVTPTTAVPLVLTGSTRQEAALSTTTTVVASTGGGAIGSVAQVVNRSVQLGTTVQSSTMTTPKPQSRPIATQLVSPPQGSACIDQSLQAQPVQTNPATPPKQVSPQQTNIQLSSLSPELLAALKQQGITQQNLHAVLQTNPGIFKALNSPPRAPKYASNVTVKSLLESRAARQKSQDEVPTSPTSTEMASSFTEASASVPASTTVTAMASIPTQEAVFERHKPAALALPTQPPAASAPQSLQVGALGEKQANITVQEMQSLHNLIRSSVMQEQATKVAVSTQSLSIDQLVKSVMTTIQTTLPTVAMKVTSPFQQQNTQRPITTATMAMKSPIPAIPQIQSKPRSSNTSVSQSSHSLNSIPTIPLATALSTAAITPSKVAEVSSVAANFVAGVKPMTRTLGNQVATGGQKNMIVRVVPQNILTPQGMIQGVVMPPGVIVPQQGMQAAGKGATQGQGVAVGNVILQNVPGKGMQLLQASVGPDGKLQIPAQLSGGARLQVPVQMASSNPGAVQVVQKVVSPGQVAATAQVRQQTPGSQSPVAAAVSQQSATGVFHQQTMLTPQKVGGTVMKPAVGSATKGGVVTQLLPRQLGPVPVSVNTGSGVVAGISHVGSGPSKTTQATVVPNNSTMLLQGATIPGKPILSGALNMQKTGLMTSESKTIPSTLISQTSMIPTNQEFVKANVISNISPRAGGHISIPTTSPVTLPVSPSAPGQGQQKAVVVGNKPQPGQQNVTLYASAPVSNVNKPVQVAVGAKQVYLQTSPVMSRVPSAGNQVLQVGAGGLQLRPQTQLSGAGNLQLRVPVQQLQGGKLQVVPSQGATSGAVAKMVSVPNPARVATAQLQGGTVKPAAGANIATAQTVAPQKLVLYNINGQLVTAQGVPVTLSQGVLKAMSQVTTQTSSVNLQTPISPVSAATPSGDVTTRPVAPGKVEVQAQPSVQQVMLGPSERLTVGNARQLQAARSLEFTKKNLATNQQAASTASANMIAQQLLRLSNPAGTTPGIGQLLMTGTQPAKPIPHRSMENPPVNMMQKVTQQTTPNSIQGQVPLMQQTIQTPKTGNKIAGSVPLTQTESLQPNVNVTVSNS